MNEETIDEKVEKFEQQKKKDVLMACFLEYPSTRVSLEMYQNAMEDYFNLKNEH